MFPDSYKTMLKVLKFFETNKRVLHQKGLLMSNLKNAFYFRLFKVNNPDIEIELSKFCELHPIKVETIGSKD